MKLINVNKIISNSEIEICSNCAGGGIVPADSFRCGASDTETCHVCKGTGRTVLAEAVCMVRLPFNFEV